MKKLILSIAMASIAVATSIAQTLSAYVPTNGLIGYWGFTGNANDLSSYANNGTVNGAVLVADRLGNANKAYQFGAGQTITVPDATYLDGMTTGLSFSFWVKLPLPTTWGNPLISKATHCQINGDDAYSITVMQNGVVRLQFTDLAGNSTYQTGSINIANNQWHHVAIVWNKPQTVIYIDGVPDLAGSYSNYFSSITPSNDPLIFGHGNFNSSCGLTYSYGESLDEICIYNRGLNQSEVTDLYTSCTAAPTATIIAIGNTPFCAGGDLPLRCTATGTAVTYQWKKGSKIINGATSDTYYATATGSYKCVVTNACGTVTSNAITATSLANAAATLTTTGSAAFCAGDSVTIKTNTPAGYAIQWYRNNISLINNTAKSFVAKQPGTYKVVTKNNTTGCSRISLSSVVATVNCRIANPNQTTGSIATEPSAIINPINLFPNPNEGSFTFEYGGLIEDENGTATIQLYNSVGQKVYETNLDVQNGRVSKELNLDGVVKSGIYLLKMEINNQVYDSKVMIN